MKAIKLITIQIISLLALIASAEKLMDNIPSTIVFFASFAAFAAASLYINRNEERLLREINVIFGRNEKVKKCI